MTDVVVLDVDGCLRDWDCSVIDKGMAFAEKHHELGRVLVIASVGESVQKWLAENFPLPFLGPFCRPVFDDRPAAVFKQALALELENEGYRIVGAADDSARVLRMWQLWAGERENPESFDLLRTTFSCHKWKVAAARQVACAGVDVEAAWLAGM